MRDVQRGRDLVEVMRLAIRRQHVANIEMRQREQVAQVLLKLDAIEPPHGPTPVLGRSHRARRLQGRLQSRQQSLPILRLHVFRLRRHVAILHPIKHLHPALHSFWISQIKRQRRQIEPALFRLRIVAIGAVLLNESGDRLRWFLGRVQRWQRGEQQHGERMEIGFHGWTVSKETPGAMLSELKE